jgi:phage terminase large subunit-like protein
VADWKVPRNEVLEYVRECYRTLNIVAGGYDPHAISWVAEDLENEGLPLFEWPQTDQHMCPATQALYEAIIDGRLAHDGDPALARHIKAARVKTTPRGGQRLVKSETGRKIDGAIALVIAIGVMERRPEERKTPRIYLPD